MKLKDYLNHQDMTAEQFAELVGSSRFAVGKWVRGERIPGKDVMRQIFKVTDGLVAPKDFYDLPAGDGEGASVTASAS